MFYQIRYQTGEIHEIIRDMKKGIIPCMDVDDINEYEWFLKQLEKHGIYRAEEIPLDKKARDPVKEPEFEFRAAFIEKSPENTSSEKTAKKKYMYIDFYFEPIVEKSYDPIYGD